MFEYLDKDEDGKISESEFFNTLLKEDYNKWLIKHYKSASTYAKVLNRKLEAEKVKNLFKLLKTDEMEVKDQRLQKNLEKISLDTDSRGYQKFEKMFESQQGRGMIKIGIMDDYLRVLFGDTKDKPKKKRNSD